MPIQFDLPKECESIIKVIGVGGGGSNAVTQMYNNGIVGVNFAICNTDSQALDQSPVPTKIQLGPGLTDGRGAGSQPEVGRNATLESIDEIKNSMGGNTRMVFVTAGMGGGTGTGGAPVVAKAARDLGLLTVGIVTTPFSFEGRKRVQQAYKGIEELKENVDTLLIISNDKMRELYGNLSISDAFHHADNVLATAAKGIAEIITVPGYVNVDFEDVNTVMRQSGVAIMGTGVADGEDRALKAVRSALSSPLLNDNDISGAKHILLNISSGSREVLMDEVADITNYIQEACGYTSEVIWGNCIDESLEDKISVTVIATGFETTEDREQKVVETQEPKRVVYNLDDDIQSKRPSMDRIVDDRRTDYDPYNLRSEAPRQQEQDLNTPSFEDRARKSATELERERRKESNSSYKNAIDRHYAKRENRDRLRMMEERRKRLKGLSLKLQNDLGDLENEPAFKRRNIHLEQPPHSSESNVSRYSLYEDEKRKAEFRKNPYLHDNVD